MSFSLELPKYCLCIQSNSADLQLYIYIYIQGKSLARGPKLLSMYTVEQGGFATIYIQGKSLARGPKLLSMYTVEQGGFATIYIYIQIYRVSLSLEAPNYCLCIQSNRADLQLYVYTG